MTWDTGYPVPDDRRRGYTHLIRSDDDPERSPRKGRKHPDYDPAPHRTLKRSTRAQVRERLLEVLGEAELTFNTIAVRGWDLTADVVFSTQVNDVLWDLVEEDVLEHTMKAPILFRRVRR